MRRFSLFVSLFVVTLFATLTLTACGGGASAANPATLTAGATTPSSSTPPPPSSTPPPTTPPPTTPPPPPSTVIDNVEDAPWLTCGACGNDHATGAVAPSSLAQNVTSPSEDGSSTQFAIAPVVPYTNVYWYQEHQAPSGQLNSITYEFDLYIPSGSENASQGIEFECQQQFNGWIYNFGWQANFVTNEWRIFNYGPATWDSSGVAFQHFTPGTWHHILTEYHNDVNSHSVFHDALTVDGVRYPVNIRHDAFNAGNVINKFTNAVQLDGNSRNDGYSIYVDHMKITYR